MYINHLRSFEEKQIFSAIQSNSELISGSWGLNTSIFFKKENNSKILY
jgi:hypothetical protein